MNEIGQQLLLSTDQRWENEEDPDGNKWQLNTPFTRRKKRARGQIDKILQASGRGRASINYKAEKDRVAVGTNVDYMRKHQLGEDGLAVRKYLGISKEDQREIAIITQDYIDRQLKN